MKALFHPVISIIAGILILLFPDLLRYVVGIYLIVTGVVALSNRS